jgi:signal transduction histidine kinase/CheY-like chemotaxis protein/HPt (histidine-containing phosphotransfer) domain-containing protein
MITGEQQKTDILKIVFRCLVIGVFLYFILAELILPAENTAENYSCESYAGEWVRLFSDGTAESVEIPGKYQIERNEEVHLQTTLPLSIANGTCFCIRSNRQDFKIYIDGQLREEYSTKKSRLFGKSSPGTFVFVDIAKEDSGKTLDLYSQTDSDYSGTFGNVYIGTEMGIWRTFFSQNSAQFMVAFAMLLMSVFTIVVSVVLRLFYHRRIAMEYMGWAVFLAAIWLLGNNGLRQLLFSNISVLNEITFFMIMLLPIPFLFFMDLVQEKRYHPAYLVMEIISVADFFVCTVLQCTNVKDFADTIIFMAADCGISILLIALTISKDVFEHRIKEYRLIAIGIGCVLTSAVGQIALYFRRATSFDGTILALGMIGLLILTVLNTIRDVVQMEKEKQQAIMEGQSKVQFLANMSHEIRTPINAVLGMDEMILRECESDDIREYAQDIHSAGRSLLSLINDILDFTKIESGKMEIVPVEYDLASVLNDCYHMIAMRAKEKNIELHIENDPGLPTRLYGDEVRVRQIITNLLTNAVKYTEIGSVTLQMTGERMGEEICIRVVVRDTGIGITEENQKKLFDSFQRVDENRNRNIEGTGLGLAISKQLVELMNGKIWVESRYGEGSAFYVEFMQKIVSAEKMGDFSERYRKTIAGMEAHGGSFTAPEARILVVDDVRMNLKVIQGLLKESKIQIDTAESGKECLELIQKNAYQIIFLDHMMPEMDGMQTLREMKKLVDYKSKDAKVIMLTANAIQGAKEEYLAAGFCDYLSKPVRAQELEEMICRYLPAEMVMSESEETTWVESRKKEKTFLEQCSFLDVKTGLSYCAEDEDFYKEMLQDYMQENHLEELITLYNSEDWENYRIQIHALKSTSLSIGAAALSEEAKKLEQAVKDGDMEYLNNYHENTMIQYRKLLEQLKKVL